MDNEQEAGKLRRIILRNFRIIDADSDFSGSLIIENNIIKKIIADNNLLPDTQTDDMTINGSAFAHSAVIMPAFIDLHAHFRDPGFHEKEASFSVKTPFSMKMPPPAEVLESAALAAAAGGYTTVVCMANTNPVIDTIEKARALKTRSDTIGLVDLYPVLPLTKNMEGQELSGIRELRPVNVDNNFQAPLLLSEDGKDVANDNLFLAAMAEAKRLGIPVSCHCDCGGMEAEAAKKAGRPRTEWSRIEENNAVRRVIELGKKAGCHIHIAHVSTKEAADMIREAKKKLSSETGFFLTCEATPHHIGAAEDDARRMGDESFGRVNPPLRSDADRYAIKAAIYDGTIDAIATDHAPHSEADKAAGSPGFSGLETAFAVCLSELTPDISLMRLSALMSANPARILGLRDRGRIEEGLRADMVITDIHIKEKVDPGKFKSRGKCSPFAGRELYGKILMTLNSGRIVFEGGIIA